MIDTVPLNARVLHFINEDEDDESQPLLVFRRDVIISIFLKYSKESISSSSQEFNLSYRMSVMMEQNIAKCHLKGKAVCAKKTPNTAA